MKYLLLQSDKIYDYKELPCGALFLRKLQIILYFAGTMDFCSTEN